VHQAGRRAHRAGRPRGVAGRHAALHTRGARRGVARTQRLRGAGTRDGGASEHSGHGWVGWRWRCCTQDQMPSVKHTRRARRDSRCSHRQDAHREGCDENRLANAGSFRRPLLPSPITPCLDRASPWVASTARAPVRAAAPIRRTDAARAATASRSLFRWCDASFTSFVCSLLPSMFTKLALRFRAKSPIERPCCL
jgi:hypothetical protein